MGTGKAGLTGVPDPAPWFGQSTAQGAQSIVNANRDLGVSAGQGRDLANNSVDTIDPRDRTTDPAPPRTLPIEGAPRDPGRSGPQGALPNPYANPR